MDNLQETLNVDCIEKNRFPVGSGPCTKSLQTRGLFFFLFPGDAHLIVIICFFNAPSTPTLASHAVPGVISGVIQYSRNHRAVASAKRCQSLRSAAFAIGV